MINYEIHIIYIGLMDDHKQWPPVWWSSAHPLSDVEMPTFLSLVLQSNKGFDFCGVAIALHQALIHRKELRNSNQPANQPRLKKTFGTAFFKCIKYYGDFYMLNC